MRLFLLSIFSQDDRTILIYIVIYPLNKSLLKLILDFIKKFLTGLYKPCIIVSEINNK